MPSQKATDGNFLVTFWLNFKVLSKGSQGHEVLAFEKDDGVSIDPTDSKKETLRRFLLSKSVTKVPSTRNIIMT